MENRAENSWLLDIFLQYQNEIDRQRKIYGDRQWLKDALETDRQKRIDGRDSASSLDAL